MKILTTCKRLLSFTILLLIALLAQGQTKNWTFIHDHAFIFELNEEQVEDLFRYSHNNSKALVKQLSLPKPITSVKMEKDLTVNWENKPEKGHFVYATLHKNEVQLFYEPAIPFQVFLIQEHDRLTVQVLDHDGNLREDAKVRIKNYHVVEDTKPYNDYYDILVFYDKETKSYTVKERGTQTFRVLTVELDNFTAYLDLEKKIPYHNYNYWRGSSSGSRIYSYLVTDKNKYKPGEKVRFKSYALTDKRIPHKEDLYVWLNNKKLQKISSNHPGNYTGEIQLHDSLELKLDTRNIIYLRDKKGFNVSFTNFMYEDYLLYDASLQVQVAKINHYHPENNILHIHATDANGLTLPDARADIRIVSTRIGEVFDDLYILPDTILKETLLLDNTGPTEMPIPAYLFGKANVTYKVLVTVHTLENQPLRSEQLISYYYDRKQLEIFSRDDKVRVEFLREGKVAPQKAWLWYDKEEDGKEIMLPYEETFDQTHESYNVRIAEHNLQRATPTINLIYGLTTEGKFSDGRFHVKTENPQQLDFTWYLYKGNALIAKGNGKELDKTFEDPEMESAFYVDLFYRLGNKDEKYSKTFTPANQQLQITTNLPERVYPGQQLETTITVKDAFGKPVRNVDLTAMAYNKLLDYYLPDLPYNGEPVQTRNNVKATYELKKRNATATIPLAYDYWNIYARLDTIDSFRFLYPRENLFSYTEPAPDSVTQFAPYVMYNGKAIDIHVIECNDAPVYFSWTTNVQGYSFPVLPDSSYSIKLRLHDRVLTIPHVRFKAGMKTILSLERDYLPEGVEQEKIPNASFSTPEYQKYRSYTSAIPIRWGSDFTWLEQNGKKYPVHYQCNNKEVTAPRVIGPFSPGRTTYMYGVEYNHTGGYLYEYEQNVVYKYTPQSPLVPSSLKLQLDDKLPGLNDFHITVDSIYRYLSTCNYKLPILYRQLEEFKIYKPGFTLSLNLTEQDIQYPAAGVTFYNKTTGKAIHHPAGWLIGTYGNNPLPPDMYDIYLIYYDGKYIKTKDIPIQNSSYIRINLQDKERCEADHQSMEWLDKFPEFVPITPPDNITNNRQYVHKTGSNYERVKIYPGEANTISGIITDQYGEPLIGVSIQIQGTTNGTVSDLDGKFSLKINNLLQPSYPVLIHYVGYKKIETNVPNSSYLDILMEEDMSMLHEVVVVGYGTSKKQTITSAVTTVSSNYLAGSIAGVAIYGARAGAIRELPSGIQDGTAVETNGDENEDTDTEAENRLYQELLTLNGLRRNFSDVGFWEPVLYTNKEGKASFNVTIPDNITQWNSVIYAMNRKMQTGTLRHTISSYKPLMGELKTPQFLVAGDSARAAATIRNYTSDKQIEGDFRYAINGDTIQQTAITFEALWQKRMPMNPVTTDSITSTFLFTRNDGYTDGEERTIPVIPAGTVIADGDLRLLKNGERVELQTQPGEEIQVRISGNSLDIYEDVAYYLMGYQYACNEQLASKLTGLLSYKAFVEQYKKEKFRYDKQVNEIIARLLRNRNQLQLWSWWGNNDNSSLWMSAHILKTLKMAQDAGYKVNIQLKWVKDDYMSTLPYRGKANLQDIELLHALSDWGAPQDYEKAVTFFEEMIREKENEYTIIKGEKVYNRQSYLREKLLLWEIRQQQGLPFNRESILPYLHTENTGRVFCDDDKWSDWRSGKLAKTLIAYRLLQNDPHPNNMKEGMQMYILGTKANYWNTYQSASVLSTILPDLLKENSTSQAPTRLKLSGKENKEITTTDFKTTLKEGEKLTIEKVEGVPVLYSSWNYQLKTEGYSTDAFSIRTHFDGNKTLLKAGEVTKLIVEVEVKQDNSEYVMVEVPIPAGCSYASKPQHRYYNEVHREYFKEKTVIFCRQLAKGNYTFEIQLLPRFTGNYHLNPAKVELMYLPVINAMNDLQKIKIAEYE